MKSSEIISELFINLPYRKLKTTNHKCSVTLRPARKLTGMSPDQAAAFTIARKAILSRGKDVKRGKRPSGWVDLHAKPESLDGLAAALPLPRIDRGLWLHRLTASAPKEQGSASPSGSLVLGESRISTD